jgi:hypothetical protein
MRTVFAMFALACASAQSLPVPAAGNVTLTIDDYNHLTELAMHPPKKPDVAPFPHVLKSAQLNLRVNADSVLGTINLDGEVLVAGNCKVPLVNGMTVLDAEQRGRELPLDHEANTHFAVLAGPGEFAITLNTALPLSIETGRASFGLPVPSAGAARLVLTVPGEQTQVNLSPGIVTSRSSQNGQTLIEATLVPGASTTVSWASRLNSSVAPAAPKEVRFLSDLHTLISATEAELAVAVLAQVTVVQGEPSEFRLAIPAGYELTGASGATLLSNDLQGATLALKVADPAARTHEFLVSLVKSNANVIKADIPLMTFLGSQRETGEVLVESDGAMELNAAEQGGLRRMDLKEIGPSLRTLSRGTLQAAFRYQKRPTETPGVALDWVRYSDSHVLSAVAQRAEVTTLVTTEGRSLSEIKLTVKNEAQPFLKVELPTGASILSAEVAGEKVKPVQGSDGSRVPLLRTGFRPSGAYEVSFVILNAESNLARTGSAGLALPKMDLPIGQVNWEVFLPQQLKVSDFGGDVRLARLFPAATEDAEVSFSGTITGAPFAVGATGGKDTLLLSGPGILSGTVTDPAGAVVPGASISVASGGRMFSAVSGPSGQWSIAGVPSGVITVTVQSLGFQRLTQNVRHDFARGTNLNQTLQVGSVAESVVVTGESSVVNTQISQNRNGASKQAQQPLDSPASANVGELQRKVVGVLPIAINIPRTGVSYQFVRPLVVDEETKLTFRYRRK